MIRRALGGLSGGSIARVASATFVVNVLSSGLRFLFQLVYARWMGPVGYGQMVVALGWASQLAPASTLGLNYAVMSFLPEYEAQRRPGLMRGLLGRSRAITFAVGSAAGAVATVLTVALSDRAVEPALLLAFALIPFLAVMQLQQEMFRAMRRPVLAYNISGLLQPVLAMAGAVAVFLFSGELKPSHAVAATLVATILAIGVQRQRLPTVLPADLGTAEPGHDVRAWLRRSTTLLVASTCQRVVTGSDVIVVGILLGPREAGLYGAASRLADLGGLVLSAVSSIVAPNIAKLHAEGEKRLLQETVWTGVRLSFWPSLLFATAIGGLSTTLLSLFGPAFTGARSSLHVLVLGNLVAASTGPCSWLLSLTGNERRLAQVGVLHALGSVLLAIVLVPRLGMVGAAVSSAATTASWNLINVVIAEKVTGIKSYPKWMARAAGNHR